MAAPTNARLRWWGAMCSRCAATSVLRCSASLRNGPATPAPRWIFRPRTRRGRRATDATVSISCLFAAVAFWRLWSKRFREPSEVAKIIIGLAISSVALLTLAAAGAIAQGDRGDDDRGLLPAPVHGQQPRRLARRAAGIHDRHAVLAAAGHP